MTIPLLPSLERTSITFAADLDAFFLTQLPATIPAFNAEMERVNNFAFGSYSATSTTSLVIGTGSKSLTIEAGKGFTVGQPVLIASTAAPSNYMSGQVTEYNSTTGAMTVNVTNIGGSGTVAAWSVSVSAVVLATAPSLAQRTITSADTLIASDQGKLINCSGTFTLAVTAAATLGGSWWCYVRNTGTGVVTLDPNGAETVDGVATGPVRDTILLVGDGTGFTASKVGPFSTLEVLTSGTSWTCPLGVRNARMRMGGGGEGGYANAGNDRSGRNGHAGGYLEKALRLSPGTAYTYAIGAAGTGVVGAAGTGGGTTSITINGTIYSASGGNSSGPGVPTNADFGLPGGKGGSTSGSGAIGVGGAHLLGSAAYGAQESGAGYSYGGAGCPDWGAGASGGPGVIILEY